ncbi:nucleotidyltransferase family protein [Desulfomarina sp.]
MSKIDLPVHVIRGLQNFFSRDPEIERVVIFGSRVMGNAKPGSDVDLAFYGENMTTRKVDKIRDYLENETAFPFFFDCILFDSINNPALKEHIEIYGELIYARK